MKSGITQLVLLGVLGLLLATPLLVRGRSAGPAAMPASGVPRVAAADARERNGFRLTESAAAAGIDFRHTAPKLDSRLDPIMPQVAVMGAAVSIADFDRDGLDDLYFCNSGQNAANALYRNQGDGTFQDVAAAMGVADLNRPEDGACMGSVWGDFDNDGYEDLFVYRWGKPALFRNDAGKRFVPVTALALGLPPWLNANAAVWMDFDRDGKLDLFVGGYYDKSLNLWDLPHTRIMPESFEYADNGGQKHLLRNNGDGTFTDVAAAMGITSTRWTLAAASADLNNDQYPDLFLANDYGAAELFINDAGKGFREVGKHAGVGASPKSGMNVCFGDVQNTGQLAVYRSNISEPGYLLQGNDLWVPTGVQADGIPRYAEIASAMGVSIGGWAWGAQFGDLNNDGLQDLYLVNGYVSADREKSYWYDFSKITGANRAIIVDAANWPPMGDASLSGYQQKKLWLNKSDTFVEVAQSAGATDVYDGRSVAMGDLFKTGGLDIVVATQKGPALLYRNDVAPDRNWLQLDLRGTASNASAIGAQVRVSFAGGQQLQEVSGGSGFCAQNSRVLHFGLGKGVTADNVEIRWPSGRTQTLTGLAVNQRHVIQEPDE